MRRTRALCVTGGLGTRKAACASMWSTAMKRIERGWGPLRPASPCSDGALWRDDRGQRARHHRDDLRHARVLADFGCQSQTLGLLIDELEADPRLRQAGNLATAQLEPGERAMVRGQHGDGLTVLRISEVAHGTGRVGWMKSEL